MTINISKRKLESYKRAELIAKEVRYLMARNMQLLSNDKLFELLKNWMNVTGKIKYKRP